MQLILNQRFIKQKEKLSVSQIANIQWKDRDSITAMNFKREDPTLAMCSNSSILLQQENCSEHLNMIICIAFAQGKSLLYYYYIRVTLNGALCI